MLYDMRYLERKKKKRITIWKAILIWLGLKR